MRFSSLIFHYSIFISVATSLFITFCTLYKTTERFRWQWFWRYTRSRSCDIFFTMFKCDITSFYSVAIWYKFLFSSQRDISHYEVIYRTARYIANSARNLYRWFHLRWNHYSIILSHLQHKYYHSKKQKCILCNWREWD